MTEQVDNGPVSEDDRLAREERERSLDKWFLRGIEGAAVVVGLLALWGLVSVILV